MRFHEVQSQEEAITAKAIGLHMQSRKIEDIKDALGIVKAGMCVRLDHILQRENLCREKSDIMSNKEEELYALRSRVDELEQTPVSWLLLLEASHRRLLLVGSIFFLSSASCRWWCFPPPLTVEL